jgi:hypothetical protein
VPAGKRQEVHVGHLPVPVNRTDIRVSQRHIVDEEVVPGGSRGGRVSPTQAPPVRSRRAGPRPGRLSLRRALDEPSPE